MSAIHKPKLYIPVPNWRCKKDTTLNNIVKVVYFAHIKVNGKFTIKPLQLVVSKWCYPDPEGDQVIYIRTMGNKKYKLLWDKRFKHTNKSIFQHNKMSDVLNELKDGRMCEKVDWLE